MRVAVISAIPVPYKTPLWQELYLAVGGDLCVYYCASGKADRPWKGDADLKSYETILPGKNLASFKGPSASCYWNPSIIKALEAQNPEALLIGGYNHLTMMSAMRWATKKGIPWYLISETFFRESKSFIRKNSKQIVLHWITRRAAGYFPTGILATEYLMAYGAKKETCCPLPNVPDVERIKASMKKLLSKRDALREEEGITDGPVFLFIGRIIGQKAVDDLVGAFMYFREKHGKGTLLLVGDGVMRSAIEEQVQRVGLNAFVKFTGFAEPDGLARYYALADVFVLPSSETWGTVAIEAAAAGLPIVISDKAGCRPDLQKLGVYVRSYPFHDVLALSLCLEEAAQEAVQGRVCQVLPLSEWTYKHMAEVAGRFLERGGRHA